jgi:hypothetical protein
VPGFNAQGRFAHPTCPTKLYTSFLRKTFARGEVGAVGTAESMLTDRVRFGWQLGRWQNHGATARQFIGPIESGISNRRGRWEHSSIVREPRPTRSTPTRQVRLSPRLLPWVTLYRLDEDTGSIKRFARCLRFLGRKSRLLERR